MSGINEWLFGWQMRLQRRISNARSCCIRLSCVSGSRKSSSQHWPATSAPIHPYRLGMEARAVSLYLWYRRSSRQASYVTSHHNPRNLIEDRVGVYVKSCMYSQTMHQCLTLSNIPLERFSATAWNPSRRTAEKNRRSSSRNIIQAGHPHSSIPSWQTSSTAC